MKEAVGVGVEFSQLAQLLYFRLSPAVSASSTHLDRIYLLNDRQVLRQVQRQEGMRYRTQETVKKSPNSSQKAVIHLDHRKQHRGMKLSGDLSIVR